MHVCGDALENYGALKHFQDWLCQWSIVRQLISLRDELSTSSCVGLCNGRSIHCWYKVTGRTFSNDPKADDVLRSILDSLPQAVWGCVMAALEEMDVGLQQALMAAAAYGQALVGEGYDWMNHVTSPEGEMGDLMARCGYVSLSLSPSLCILLSL